MANYSRIKGLTVVLTADTKEVTKKLDSFAKQTQKSVTALKDINKLLKLNPTSTVLLSQKQAELTRNVNDATKQLKAEEEALKQIKKQPQTEQTIEQQKKLERQVEETKAELKEAQKELRNFGSVGAQQLAVVGEKMKEVGDKVYQFGRDWSRYVTLPIVGMGTFAVKETADFEQSMAKVGAVAQASGEEVEQMSAYARELASTTKFTAGEVTDAYYYMALAGWKPAESMEGLEGVLNLVSASGEDLGRVSDIVTDGLTAFGKTAKDSTHFADVLAVAMSNSNTTVDLLGEAFKYVAPVAGQMGYEVEDVAVALGIMANNGIKGSTAGTSLRNVMTNLAKPTAEMQDAMDNLGISLDDGKGNMYSFAEVMGQLRSSLGNIKIPMEEFEASVNLLDSELENGTISEEEYNKQLEVLMERAYGAEGALKAQYASTLAGKRGMAGLMAIVGASEEEWNGLTEAIENADGTSEDMRKTMEDTLSGQILILKSQVAELGMQFGEIMLPVIRDVVEWLQQLAVKFQNLSPETKELIAKILGIVAVVGPLLMIIGKVVAFVGTILTVIPKVIGIIKVIAGVIGAINPVILAVIVVGGALVRLIIKHWDTIKETTIKVFGAIRDFLSNAWNTIKEKAVEIWNSITETLSAVWENIKTVVTTVFDGIKAYFETVFNVYKTIFTTVWNVIKSYVTGVWEGIKRQAQIIWNAIKMAVTNPIGALKYFLSNTWANIKSTASTIWNGIKTAITKPIESARDKIKSIIDRIKGFFPISLKNIFSGFKLPHISITQKEGILGIKYPKFNVDWYKKAYNNGILFDSPTVLPTLNGYKGFGDGNGAELVIGQNSLLNMIQRASGSSINAEAIYNAVQQGASNANVSVYIDGKDVTAVVNRHNTKQQIGNLRFSGVF